MINPAFDPELLDELARVFAQAALDQLLLEAENAEDPVLATEENADE
jgi:hypothetical protein